MRQYFGSMGLAYRGSAAPHQASCFFCDAVGASVKYGRGTEAPIGRTELHSLDEEDEATLAAIDRGINAADKGRVVSFEQARRRLHEWLTKSPSQPAKPTEKSTERS